MQIFEFDEIEQDEKAIKETWEKFKEELKIGNFKYNEVDKAKKCIFLKQYDDLFNINQGLQYKTIKLKDIKNRRVGRGAKLQDKEIVNYERFIPKKEFIKESNRFSPKGIEWLYLAIGGESEIKQCAKAECRATIGDRFGFCDFEINSIYYDLKIVDLTIADDISYLDLNKKLENYGQKQLKKVSKMARKIGYAPMNIVNKLEFKEVFKEWAVYTYAKLLSEQIFVPLADTEDKNIIYAPFQSMAQYYISLGYSGIMYGSTVCNVGKNIVLFDKNIASPTGSIEVSQIQ